MSSNTDSFSARPKLKDLIAVSAILAMVLGMLHARALASIGMIVLVINGLLWSSSRLRIRTLLKDRFAIILALFFCSYLVSGLWSDNTGYWLNSVLIKLPFLLLPVGFLSLNVRSLNIMRALVYGLSLILMINVFKSVAFYFEHKAAIVTAYGSSKVLPTSIYNDHIRFSLTLVMVTLLNLFLLLDHRPRIGRTDKIISSINIIVLGGFIHLLATKTGLISFYIMLTVTGFGKLYSKHKLLALGFILLLLTGGYLAFLKVPTLNAKVKYVLVEVRMMQNPAHELDYNFSDQGRLISYKMALDVLKRAPVIGVGSGDVKDQMDHSYRTLQPDVPKENRLIPHNQLLYVMLAAGVLPAIIFLTMVLLPFFLKRSRSVYTVSMAAVFLFAMQVESMLEIQFGVLVYLLFCLLFLQIGRTINEVQRESD